MNAATANYYFSCAFLIATLPYLSASRRGGQPVGLPWESANTEEDQGRARRGAELARCWGLRVVAMASLRVIPLVGVRPGHAKRVVLAELSRGRKDRADRRRWHLFRARARKAGRWYQRDNATFSSETTARTGRERRRRRSFRKMRYLKRKSRCLDVRDRIGRPWQRNVARIALPLPTAIPEVAQDQTIRTTEGLRRRKLWYFREISLYDETPQIKGPTNLEELRKWNFEKRTNFSFPGNLARLCYKSETLRWFDP